MVVHALQVEQVRDQHAAHFVVLDNQHPWCACHCRVAACRTPRRVLCGEDAGVCKVKEAVKERVHVRVAGDGVGCRRRVHALGLQLFNVRLASTVQLGDLLHDAHGPRADAADLQPELQLGAGKPVDLCLHVCETGEQTCAVGGCGVWWWWVEACCWRRGRDDGGCKVCGGGAGFQEPHGFAQGGVWERVHGELVPEEFVVNRV